MKVTYRADGVTDILASLGRLKSERLETAKDVCKQFAREVVQEARAKAPVKTGRLRRSIHSRLMSRKDSFEIGFGWRKKGWYGLLVEYGTKRNGARPHLRAAFDQRVSGLEERIGDAVEELIK
jgi:HK97 gp10 family phage protein